MVMIQKENNHYHVSYSKHKPHPEVIRSVENFGHLIENGKVLWAREFAHLIEAHYDIKNPKIAFTVDMLKSAR